MRKLSLGNKLLVLVVFIVAIPGSCFGLAIVLFGVCELALGIELQEVDDDRGALIALCLLLLSTVMAFAVARVLAGRLSYHDSKSADTGDAVVLREPLTAESSASKSETLQPARASGTRVEALADACSHNVTMPPGFTIDRERALTSVVKVLRADEVLACAPCFVHRLRVKVRQAGRWDCQERQVNRSAFQQARQQYQVALQLWKANAAKWSSMTEKPSWFAGRVMAGQAPTAPREGDFYEYVARDGVYEVATESSLILTGVDQSELSDVASGEFLRSMLGNTDLIRCLDRGLPLVPTDTSEVDARESGVWFPDLAGDEVDRTVLRWAKTYLESERERVVLKQAPKHRQDLSWKIPEPSINIGVEKQACPLWLLQYRRGRQTRWAVVCGTTGKIAKQ